MKILLDREDCKDPQWTYDAGLHLDPGSKLLEDAVQDWMDENQHDLEAWDWDFPCAIHVWDVDHNPLGVVTLERHETVHFFATLKDGSDGS